MKCQCCGQEIPEPTSDRFLEFKAIYPRKKDFPKAEKIWKRQGLDKIADQILFHVKQSIAKDKSWKEGYIPLPTTYLNGQRWTDEIEVEAKPEFKWPTTNEGWEDLANRHGIKPEPGKGWPEFKKKIIDNVMSKVGG
jgi:hypothetical protein